MSTSIVLEGESTTSLLESFSGETFANIMLRANFARFLAESLRLGVDLGLSGVACGSVCGGGCCCCCSTIGFDDGPSVSSTVKSFAASSNSFCKFTAGAVSIRSGVAPSMAMFLAWLSVKFAAGLFPFIISLNWGDKKSVLSSVPATSAAAAAAW